MQRLADRPRFPCEKQGLDELVPIDREAQVDGLLAARFDGIAFNLEIVMTHTQIHRIRHAAASLLATSALAAGLMASTTTMAAVTGFDARMDALITHVKDDPNYKRLPLKTTADREWFNKESEALFSKKITKEQFVADGAKQFPGYEASLATVADFMSAQ